MYYVAEFEWDPGKARANLRKHGVSFEEARSVFNDEHARFLSDTDDYSGEERYILVGMSEKFRVLAVCHCFRGEDAAVRIISARRATRTETSQYEGYLR